LQAATQNCPKRKGSEIYTIIKNHAAGGAFRSLSEMGAMLTMLTTGVKPGSTGNANRTNAPGNDQVKRSSSKKEENLVMDTKLKIIDILQFIMDVRLDYRISCLLSIFKKEFDDSTKSDRLITRGVRGIDLEGISEHAEGIFASSVLDLDGTGGKTFLRVLLHLGMHDYPPLVSGA
jgi:hypothetical protein